MLPSPSPSPSSIAAAADPLNWDAISAFSTLAAVLVSLLALGFQRHREYTLRLAEETRQHRAQAGLVSVWYDETSNWLWIENRSEQPIYDAGTTVLLPSGQPAPDGHTHMPLGLAGGVLRVVPPRHRAPVATVDWMNRTIPLLAFRDAQGTTWYRDQHGTLTELETGVFEHFGVTPEYGYASSYHSAPI